MVLENRDRVFPSEDIVAQDGYHVSIDTGESRLRQLGYKQELNRSLSVISNFAFCFAIISVLQGITTLYSQGLNYGGPISMIYGWLIAGFFTMFVGLSMAEICSSYPTSGVFVLMILIPTVTTKRASVEFISNHFNTDNGVGIQSKPYIFVLGLLMSNYTLDGYDASVHLVEETKNADRNGPKGIISAIVVSFIVGWGYLLGITFAVTDIPHLLNPDKDAGGYAAAQLFYDAFKSRYGSGVGGIICFGVAGVAVFFCGMGTITNNSRMVYAFSRDGAMPYSSVWHKLNKNEVPVNAVWLSVCISFCMALTSLLSSVAFESMVSIATVRINISYAIPIFYRVTVAHKSFTRGPFNLGCYGTVVGWIAVLWVATITILFSLPVEYPITRDTFNYTPAAIGGLIVLVVSWWILDARYWFKGPVTNIDTTIRTN
ncbi:hypothetical protein C5167_005402 [Papaver somniferum]|uniref:Amino acid permease/ SLC12A domain-containing protein n=1 Tax=Papaver somniferum TaxID=3469 RepID=A0A4Y7JEB7_PAPSO|nr:hypothetical protein C5167_005402 [Papaver somniferum]